MGSPEDLLSAEEALEYLGISRATLWKLIDRYRIQRYRMPLKGKRIFLRRGDLDRLREPFAVEDEGAEESGKAA